MQIWTMPSSGEGLTRLYSGPSLASLWVVRFRDRYLNVTLCAVAPKLPHRPSPCRPLAECLILESLDEEVPGAGSIDCVSHQRQFAISQPFVGFVSRGDSARCDFHWRQAYRCQPKPGCFIQGRFSRRGSPFRSIDRSGSYGGVVPPMQANRC
jgi:hypothetical protein